MSLGSKQHKKKGKLVRGVTNAVTKRVRVSKRAYSTESGRERLERGNLKRNRVLKVLVEVVGAPNQAIRPNIVWNVEGVV